MIRPAAMPEQYARKPGNPPPGYPLRVTNRNVAQKLFNRSVENTGGV